MKSIELLSIGIRLLGIYTLLLAAKTAGALFQAIPQLGMAKQNGFADIFMFIAGGEVVLLILAGVLMLKLPYSIACWLLPQTPDTEPVLNGSAKDIQTAIFCVLGVYILSRAMPDLVNNSLFWYATANTTNSIFQSEYFLLNITTLVEIAIGFYLCLQAQGLSNFLWRLQKS